MLQDDILLAEVLQGEHSKQSIATGCSSLLPTLGSNWLEISPPPQKQWMVMGALPILLILVNRGGPSAVVEPTKMFYVGFGSSLGTVAAGFEKWVGRLEQVTATALPHYLQ